MKTENKSLKQPDDKNLNSLKNKTLSEVKQKKIKFLNKKNKLQMYEQNLNCLENDDIVTDNLTYTYVPKTPYEFTALKDINIKLTKKNIIGIIGSTGSGKSTLGQHFNGLLIPTNGQIVTHGHRITSVTKKIQKIKDLRKKVGVVFQFPEYQLFEQDVKTDIMFGPIQLGTPREQAAFAANKYLNLVGLDDFYLDRSPFDLSGGQKRRVAVAGILAMDGNTLVLDEPTAGLDPKGEKDFITIFKNLNHDDNKRIILITHNMDHVLEICDKVIVLHQGKLKTFDTPKNIFAQDKLMIEINIQLPKIYDLLYKIKKKDPLLDFTNANIKKISDLVNYVIKKYSNKI